VLAIRKATPQDVGRLTSIAKAAYARYLPRMGRAPAPVTADYAAQVASGAVWVAEGRGGVVGLLVLVARPDHLLLENVAVDPAVQGRGIGAKLLATAEQQAAALGLSEIRLYTNAAMTENLDYYPRHGYVQTHRGQEDGFDRVYFSKHLPSSRYRTSPG
jgi:N-acetylglutamate synthase-like GNAT family acetyltransferase